MIALPGAPFPVTYRELWLPPSINENATLPTSVEGGHELAFTGARKGTTADGVHFTGAATSNINCGAIHDNAATYWVKLRFKFDQAYAAGSGDMYLWGKFVDATHFVWLVFKTADGKLYFEGQDGGANDFSIAAQDGAADITTWEAGRWYTVLASISAANDVRFIIDNGTVVTVVTPIAFPNGGDFIIGDYDDPGAGTGFEGVIADFVGSTIDNTADEEYDLYAGIPPADAVNSWLLDEGRGVTAYDRGSGGNNGTLDTSCTWAFGQVQQPVLSLDGINDHGQSSAGVDISGDLMLVWVGKMKSTYDGLSAGHVLTLDFIDGNNRIRFRYNIGDDAINWHVRGGGTSQVIHYPLRPTIDDYLILIGTLTLERIALYVNGNLHNVSAGVVAAGAATAFIASSNTPAEYDISKPLFVALIDGAFTDKQALAYSRYLRNVFNLPISI